MSEQVRALLATWRAKACAKDPYTHGQLPEVVQRVLFKCADELDAALAAEPPRPELAEQIARFNARFPREAQEQWTYESPHTDHYALLRDLIVIYLAAEPPPEQVTAALRACPACMDTSEPEPTDPSLACGNCGRLWMLTKTDTTYYPPTVSSVRAFALAAEPPPRTTEIEALDNIPDFVEAPFFVERGAQGTWWVMYRQDGRSLALCGWGDEVVTQSRCRILNDLFYDAVLAAAAEPPPPPTPADAPTKDETTR